jgi:four helix bundle protein
MSVVQHGDHRNLVVWQKAMRLAAEVHRVTVTFPRDELFGLTSQIRRAAVSIPSNLAEGSARRTTPEFIAFLHIARGSQAELDTQLRLAHEFGYLYNEAFSGLIASTEEIGRLLTAVIAGLRRRQAG